MERAAAHVAALATWARAEGILLLLAALSLGAGSLTSLNSAGAPATVTGRWIVPLMGMLCLRAGFMYLLGRDLAKFLPWARWGYVGSIVLASVLGSVGCLVLLAGPELPGERMDASTVMLLGSLGESSGLLVFGILGLCFQLPVNLIMLRPLVGRGADAVFRERAGHAPESTGARSGYVVLTAIFTVAGMVAVGLAFFVGMGAIGLPRF